MSTLSLIFITLGVAVMGLLAYAATRPDEFRVERHARIAAPADHVWPLVSELRAFNRWKAAEKMSWSACGAMLKAGRSAQASFSCGRWPSPQISRNA